MILMISKSLQRIPKSAMRSRDVKIQILMRVLLEGDEVYHVLRFTRCKAENRQYHHGIRLPATYGKLCRLASILKR